MLSRVRSLVLAAMAGVAAISALGCASAHAKAASEVPSLDMPPPPPRMVEEPNADPPPPVGLMEEPARNTTPATVRRQQPPARPDAGRPDQPRTDPAPPSPPVEAPASKPVEERPKPSTTLQTPPVGGEGELERNVRGAMLRATTDLNRIDTRTLNAEGRTQYETAKNLLRQADEALRETNLVLAKTVADKAAALAAQLAGR